MAAYRTSVDYFIYYWSGQFYEGEQTEIMMDPKIKFWVFFEDRHTREELESHVEDTVERALNTGMDYFIFEKQKLGDSDTDFRDLYDNTVCTFEFLRRWFCGGVEVDSTSEEDMDEGEDGVDEEEEGEDMNEMENGVDYEGEDMIEGEDRVEDEGDDMIEGVDGVYDEGEDMYEGVDGVYDEGEDMIEGEHEADDEGKDMSEGLNGIYDEGEDVNEGVDGIHDEGQDMSEGEKAEMQNGNLDSQGSDQERTEADQRSITRTPLSNETAAVISPSKLKRSGSGLSTTRTPKKLRSGK